MRKKLVCGILGYINFTETNVKSIEDEAFKTALNLIQHRGPDNQNFKRFAKNNLFGHTRLSIIDTDSRSNQPFFSEEGRYILIFNGEIYNFHDLKNELINDGIQFKTSGDTEVLLNLLIKYKSDALHKLDGFFAFGFHDLESGYSLIARDRIGIKPLYYKLTENDICFASELTPISKLQSEKEIDQEALELFFSLTYIPAPFTILKGVNKLFPGECIEIQNGKVEQKRYYEINQKEISKDDFETSKGKLKNLLTNSVMNRLVSDVDLGCFLSGGIDSSIISTLAREHKTDLNTYSIGFENANYFDETHFADAVAKKIGSHHTVFKLKDADFIDDFEQIMHSFDEPFGDSSAIAVNLLSKYTSQEVKVSLSGDGADELFAGYNKYRAEFLIRNLSLSKKIAASTGNALLKPFPASRTSKISNLKRKLGKLNQGIQTPPTERYINWISNGRQAGFDILKRPFTIDIQKALSIPDIKCLNDQLISDQNIVLSGDMLKKVDLMSMAHALEVRTPFLDHKVVEFANSLPEHFKINKNQNKHILIETFKNELPKELWNRPKKGFEVPLQFWINSVWEKIDPKFFDKHYINQQNLFDTNKIQTLQEERASKNLGDRIYVLWNYLVFQYWYATNMSN
ncbi:MAG: asparagine synthase (glutamine-hydrolyzing) [Crocinitomicaceae bacterium]|nr:asparagine synthase (glutamine-hydrolyzing) [Crocinitomicaceae bacterium]